MTYDAESERTYDFVKIYLPEVASRRIEGARNVPALNISLLRQVMELIESEPDRHDQASWASRTVPDDEANNPCAQYTLGEVCGTKFCFAGHAVHLAYPQARPVFRRFSRDVSSSVQLYPGNNAAFSYYDAVAIIELGLTTEESALLFGPTNTVEQLREMVDALIDAENQRLDKPNQENPA